MTPNKWYKSAIFVCRNFYNLLFFFCTSRITEKMWELCELNLIIGKCSKSGFVYLILSINISFSFLYSMCLL